MSVVVIGCSVAINSNARSSELDQIYSRCGEQYGFAGGIAVCLLDADKRYGQRLAKKYHSLRSRMNKGQSRRLRASQKTWLRLQEQACGLRKSLIEPEGQNIAQAEYARCLVKTTIERFHELSNIERDFADYLK